MTTRGAAVPVDAARIQIWSAAVAVRAYTGAVVVAQLVLGVFGPTVGLLANVLVLPVLLNHALFAGRLSEELNPGLPVFRPTADALSVLSLVPLLGILQATLPVDEQSEASYALMSAAMLAAAILIAKPAPLKSVGRLFPASPEQVVFSMLGWPLSLLAYVIVHPGSGRGELLDRPRGVVALGVLIVGGLVWELIFRGMLQPVLGAATQSSGVCLGAVVSAAAGAGTGSLGYATVMGGAGLLFGWYAHRSGSILGTSLAHGALNIGLVLAWPLLL